MMSAPDQFLAWVSATLLISLRISPILAFAPPFSLFRTPALIRVLVALGLSGLMAATLPGTAVVAVDAGSLIVAAARELLIGVIFVLAFQVAFAAIYVAGRTIDIQTGFGLAALVDPSSGAQTPLIGSLYAYAAAAIFFGLNGHLDLMRIVAASVEAVPLGQATLPETLGPLSAFLATAFGLAFGVAGGIILALFVADVAIALISRTAPQMNALVLGFQVKTLLLMIALPLTLGVSGALLARLAAVTLEALPALIA